MMEMALRSLMVLVIQALAVQVGRQYRARHAPPHLLWGTALLFLAVGGGCRALGEGVGWSPFIYRLWYLASVLLPMAYLGQGAVYLLTERRIANVTFGLLLSSTAIAVWGVFHIAIAPPQQVPEPGLEAWAGAAPPMLRWLALSFSLFGALCLGAAMMQRVWYCRRGGDKVQAIGMLLLSLGTLAVSLGSYVTPAFRLLPAIGQLVGGGLVYLASSVMTRSAQTAPLHMID